MKKRFLCFNYFIPILVLISFISIYANADEVIGCGGFIKSNTEINYKIIKVKLLNKDGAVKYLTESSPVNGYYMIPIYSKGEYILQVAPPPGWSFEPAQVNINVDGKTDPCSKNEDINFFFKGFGLSGKIVTHGDPKLNGPAGIKLNLLTNNQIIDTTESGVDGSYYFSNVMPGAYVVEANHPTIKFITDRVSVILSKENWSAQDNIVVSGFKLEGLVTTSDKSPVRDVVVELFYEDKSYSTLDIRHFECDLMPKLNSDLKICQTKTDENGKFTFGNVVFAKYKIKTSLAKDNLVFNMQPDILTVDLTKHKNVVLEKPFVLNSISIKSQAYLSDKDKLLPSGEVYVNGEKNPIQVKNGEFLLSNMVSGSYKINIKSKNVYFEEKLVNIDLSSSSCLQKDSSQYGRILSLSKFVAKAFDVCGEVRVMKDQNNGALLKSLVKSIKIKCYEADAQNKNLKLVKSTGLDENFKYCLELDANVNYIIKAELSDSLAEQLRLVPSEKKIKIIDSPLFDVNFEQLEAKLEGKIKLLPKQTAPSDFIVNLKSVDSNWNKDISIKCTNEDVKNKESPIVCTFGLTNLLFGKYYLTTNYDDLFCWKKQEENSGDVLINVNSEIQNVLIEQVGYKLNYELTHKNVLLKVTESNKRDKVLIMRNVLSDSELSGSFCLPQALTYNLLIESCHKFTQNKNEDMIVIESNLFKKNSNKLKLNALKHQIIVDILFKFDDPNDKKSIDANDFLAEISSKADKSQTELISFKLKSESGNELLFTSKTWYPSNDLVTIVVKSKKVLFESTTKELIVNEINCALNHVQFESKLGIFIAGLIKPSDIDGIELKLRSTNDNSILQTVIVNGAQGFKLGPLKSPFSLYDVELSKSGYLFSKSVGDSPSKDTHQVNFQAQKLGQLKVTVVNTKTKSNLENVLLSLSSENRLFRQNLKTDSNGHVSFDNLKPGLYYLIIMMQEYEFVPNSHPIQITDGYHMNLVIEANRIAYSCFGRVTSINGQTEKSVVIEAIGVKSTTDSDSDNEACKSSQESSKLDEELGTYRIFNLKPKCVYEIRVKQISDEKNKMLKLVPDNYMIEVESTDIMNKNFVVLEKLDKLDLSIAVSYKSVDNPAINYKTMNNFVRLRLFKTNQPDSIIQTLFTPANTVAYFNELLRDQAQQYSIQIDLLLASGLSLSSTINQQQLMQLQQQPVIQKTELSFYADSAHKHLQVNFVLDSKNNANLELGKQQYQNFYFTLPLFVLIVGLLLNSKLVKGHLNNLYGFIHQRGGFFKFFQSLLNPQQNLQTTAPAGNQGKLSKSAYHQQKVLGKDSDSERSKSTPRTKHSNQTSASSSSQVQAQPVVAAPTIPTDFDDFEQINIDPNDDIDIPIITKRKPKKI